MYSQTDRKLVFKQGKTVRHSFFFIKFLKNQLGYGRAIVLIPLTVSKIAVVRNRIKRLLYDQIEKNRLLDYPVDTVINVSPIIVDKSPGEIKSEFDRASKAVFSQLQKWTS